MDFDVGTLEPAPLPALSRQAKAAVVVRLLIAEGGRLPLTELPALLQAELAQQMMQMRFVDRDTLQGVVEEFAAELDNIGITFPPGVDGALALLDGAISPDLAARLRQQAGALWEDPWEVIALQPVDRIVALLSQESTEIGAVVLSKLPVQTAAAVLKGLPGPDARRLTLGVSETGAIAPQAVHRIGTAIASELQAQPPRAFEAAAARLGAILDASQRITRDEVLAGIEEEDPELAAAIRATIFTFDQIPVRVAPEAVPELAQRVGGPDLACVVAHGGPQGSPAVSFLLDNIPRRLADAIRDEASLLKSVAPEDAEEAERRIAATVRNMADQGVLRLAD